MILEQAILQVKAGQQVAFETAMRQAQPLIAATTGFLRLELRACLETANQYLLLVWWQRLENHTEDFRGSARYQEWRALLHPFYEPFPTVEHYAEPLIVTEPAST
jgi:heme-degrading monooxygenase HmoA